jgi:hypothetical protein
VQVLFTGNVHYVGALVIASAFLIEYVSGVVVVWAIQAGRGK